MRSFLRFFAKKIGYGRWATICKGFVRENFKELTKMSSFGNFRQKPSPRLSKTCGSLPLIDLRKSPSFSPEGHFFEKIVLDILLGYRCIKF